MLMKKEPNLKHISVETIKRITVDDVKKIKSYRLLRHDNTSVHQFEFLDGGHCKVVCKGAKISSSVINSTWRIDEDGTIIVGFPKSELTCTCT